MKKTFTLFVFLIGVVVWGYGQSPATYNSSGTFTVPAGVTSITVQAWGGGGAGGGSTNAGTLNARGGAGGGGGAFASSTITVTPGASLNVVVGAQVAGISGTTGPNGNHSTIVGYESQIYASGGSGGAANISGGSPAGGAGGPSGSPTAGSSTIAGGNGGNGSTGLGASSGAGGNGANGGGIGGASLGFLNTATGNPGDAPGGGGSGGRTSQNGGAQAGGAGAPGRVIITWTCPTYTITTTTVTASPNPGNGNVATVQVTGLPEGTYTVDYTFSMEVSTATFSSSMTVNGMGVGTFTTGVLSGYTQTSTITITNLSSGTAPGICSNTVSSSAALPVTWLSFRAALDGDDVQLAWSTASESNNEGFDVQRSENGREWQTIAFVKGAGTTSEITNYNYTDHIQSLITNHQSLYYRLQQRDYDGTTDYSPVRVIQLEKENAIRVFPNPADEAVTVAFAEPLEKRGTIQLFNPNGRLVAEETLAPGTSEHTIRVAYLPAGTYVLRVVAGAQVWMQRVVVE